MRFCVEIDRISKIYRKGKTQTKAIQDFSLSVVPGSQFALLGPNGSGKSSLIRILAGLSKHDSGRVQICGLNPLRDSRKLQSKIGVALQDNDLDPKTTVREHLIFQSRLFGFGGKASKDRAAEMIELFDLREMADKRTEALSGGYKRRLHCALALIHYPEILILDEPTVGMDPEARSNFWKTIKDYCKTEGATLFLTTQYLDEAERYVEKITVLREGQSLFSGSISDFKTRVAVNGSLEDHYLTFIKGVTE